MFEAFKHGSFEHAGRLIDASVKLSLWGNHKRYWHEGLPLKNEDLLDSSWSSKPLHIEELLIRRKNYITVSRKVKAGELIYL